MIAPPTSHHYPPPTHANSGRSANRHTGAAWRSLPGRLRHHHRLEERLQRQCDRHKPGHSAHQRLGTDVDLPRQPDDLDAVEREPQPERRSRLGDQRQLDRYDPAQWRQRYSRLWGFLQWGQRAADRFCTKRGGLQRQ